MMRIIFFAQPSCTTLIDLGRFLQINFFKNPSLVFEVTGFEQLKE